MTEQLQLFAGLSLLTGRYSRLLMGATSALEKNNGGLQ